MKLVKYFIKFIMKIYDTELIYFNINYLLHYFDKKICI